MNKQRSIFLFLVILLVLTPFSSAFSIFDLDGSMALITDSNGNVIEETTYKPYGEVIDDGKSRFLYTRKELDANTKMYYYGARYYDPFFRHFTQPDQNIPDVYNPQDLNRYSYVRNNPYKYVDPSGESHVIAIAISVAVGASLSFGAEIAHQRIAAGHFFNLTDRNFSWNFNTGDDTKTNSTIDFNLSQGEDMFVEIQYIYVSSGTHTIITTATNGTISHSENLTVEVT